MLCTLARLPKAPYGTAASLQPTGHKNYAAVFVLENGTQLQAPLCRSARARRLRLSLSDDGFLRLTAPAGWSLASIAAALPEFLPWLTRAEARYQSRKPQTSLPRSIGLPVLGKELAVCFGGDFLSGRKASGQADSLFVWRKGAERVLVLERGGQLELYGLNGPGGPDEAGGPDQDKGLVPSAAGPLPQEPDVPAEEESRAAQAAPLPHAEAAALALQGWCRRRAAAVLPPRVMALAAREALPLAAVSVGDQRSRWGSCSRGRPADPSGPAPAGRIHLNWRAILLPLPLLEHLMWHELCHLLHMNHSAAYRAALARYSPRWQEREKELDAFWRALPWWALPRR